MDLGTVQLNEYLNPQYCPKLYLIIFDWLDAKTQLPRSQALGGDADPEALPPIFRGRASGYRFPGRAREPVKAVKNGNLI